MRVRLQDLTQAFQYNTVVTSRRVHLDQYDIIEMTLHVMRLFWVLYQRLL